MNSFPFTLTFGENKKSWSSLVQAYVYRKKEEGGGEYEIWNETNLCVLGLKFMKVKFISQQLYVQQTLAMQQAINSRR